MSDHDTIEKIIADLHPWLPKAISIQFAQRLRSLRQVQDGWVLVPREPTPEMVAVAVLALHETASLGLRNADAARNAWIAMVEETCRTHKAVPSGDDEVRVQNFYSRAMRELVEEGERATQTTIRARAEQLHKAFLANPAPPTSGIPLAGYDPNFCPSSNPENPQEATPAQSGAIAWESTTVGYIKYITDERYQKFGPEIRKWYKPYRCTNCAQAGAELPERDKVMAQANFRAACYSLVGIVDGVEGRGRRWAAAGERLKDTPEWVAFYNAVSALRNGELSLAHAAQVSIISEDEEWDAYCAYSDTFDGTNAQAAVLAAVKAYAKARRGGSNG